MQATRLDNLLVAFFPLGLDVFDLLLRRVFQRGHFGLPAAAQHNVCAATGHVGGDGHPPWLPGLGNDAGFLLVEFGVQYLVVDTGLGEHGGEQFRGFNGHRTHQHRRVLGDAGFDVFDHRIEFFFLGEEHQIVVVLAGHLLVGGDHHHIEAIDLAEFKGFGIGGAGHARQLVVNAEVVLEGGGSQGLAFTLDGGALLRLDGLVQTFRQTPARHGATGVLIDQDHLTILDDVFHIPVEQVMGAQGTVDMVDQAEIGGLIEAVFAAQQAVADQQVFGFLVPLLGEFHLAGFLVDDKVAGLVFGFRGQLLHQHIDALVKCRAVLGGAGDDQRRARLVDQDRIHFIDNGVKVAALGFVLQAQGHVVAQVIEAELVVGAVGNVGGVGFLAAGDL